MSEKSRKSFTSQHKAKVALEAIRGTKTLNEIAQEFAVHPTQVGEWKKVLLACKIRTILDPHSDLNWTPIPEKVGQSFRF